MRLNGGRAGFQDAPTVRVAAGPWTSLFIARSLATFTSQADAPPIALMAAGGTVDLHRREAQIGIRNRRPEAEGLAARRLAPVAFAVYQTAASGDDDEPVGWIALTPPGPPLPSAIWLEQRLGRSGEGAVLKRRVSACSREGRRRTLRLAVFHRRHRTGTQTCHASHRSIDP